METEGQVILYFLDAHAAFFQAGEAAQPGHVPLVKDAAVVFVPLHVGDKALVAVEFQGLVGETGLFADLHHSVKHALTSFLRKIHDFRQKIA